MWHGPWQGPEPTLLVWAERKAAASLAARLNSMQDMSPRGLLVTSTVRPLSLREQYGQWPPTLANWGGEVSFVLLKCNVL